MEQTFSEIDLEQLESDFKKAYEEKLKPALKNMREVIEKTKQLVKSGNPDADSKKPKK